MYAVHVLYMCHSVNIHRTCTAYMCGCKNFQNLLRFDKVGEFQGGPFLRHKCSCLTEQPSKIYVILSTCMVIQGYKYACTSGFTVSIRTNFPNFFHSIVLYNRHTALFQNKFHIYVCRSFNFFITVQEHKILNFCNVTQRSIFKMFQFLAVYPATSACLLKAVGCFVEQSHRVHQDDVRITRDIQLHSSVVLNFVTAT